MQPVLYYTVSRKEVRPREMPAYLPLLLSATSFAVASSNGTYRLVPPRGRLPAGPKGADCGGFVATTRWGAQYRFTPKQYIGWLLQWRPQWAATFDLCCFDVHPSSKGFQQVYPGKEVVRARQEFATQMVEHFWALHRLFPWTWCPTIQGFYPEEFERHARALAPLIRIMYAYYSDPAWADEDDEECPFRVGIGSLCGRARPSFLLSVIEHVQQEIGEDIPLHLWGVKLKTLQAGVSLPGVISLDTGAWNGLWGQEHQRRKASSLSPVDYSWQVSHPRYAHRVEMALSPPQQLPLAFSSPSLPWHRVMLSQRKIADAVANEEDGSEEFILQNALASAVCRGNI